MKNTQPIEIKNISKAFPGVQALNDVSLCFQPGEVHALIGENGAGKSTLIKIIGGVYKRDSGEVCIRGETCEFNDVIHAQKMGVSIIHQELSLIPDLPVMENLCMGREPLIGKTGLINKTAMRKLAREIMEPLGLKINPDTYVRDLSTADQQMVEIARAVSKNASLVIMDEPTSSLSSREVRTLFDTINLLKKNNVAVVYVSHILSEVLEIADRITVLRDGCFVRTLDKAEADEKLLVKLMVGREIKDFFSHKEKEIGEVVLEVKHLTRAPHFSDISFNLRKGEIVGISGLVGSGRTELIRTIFGADQCDSGEMILNEKKLCIKSPREAIQLGIGLVPEDRRLQGLLLELPVRQNISLPSLGRTAKSGFIDREWEKSSSKSYIEKLKIRTPSDAVPAKKLSGGNQQKIVLAKWLAAVSKILLLDEPTRGIDVNAKAELYALMNAYAKDGGSIIMVSSDLPEILGVSDRIVVFREGRLTGILDRSEATEEKIMMLAN